MTDAAPKAAVIGWPVTHSRSPVIHGHWLQTHGLAGSYGRLAIAPEEADAFFFGFRDSELAGANVTLPHKLTALSACDVLSDSARAIGAVNTLWREGERVLGDNTDGYGFLANLDQQLPGWDADRGLALVLGAGGAARAIIHALLERGFDRVAIANRTRDKAEALATSLPGSEAVDWDSARDPDPAVAIVVNTTSLGMGGGPGPAIDLARLGPDAVVTDIVYTPIRTELLVRATAVGLRTVDGLGMLLHQAVPGFERWFGVRPSVTDELRRIVLDDIAEAS
ncbi:shikimate dehydrogenase [Amorphus coralli]|uniref:shikimate dehydrogenase n=1 Tax=Amorphus coralli TaxID=340680 RepID=UPI00037403DC|nr:shikimate dehydrogenase [Amorphus coralli]